MTLPPLLSGDNAILNDRLLDAARWGPVRLLLRHGERHAITQVEDGPSTPITAGGAVAATRLGERMNRRLRTVASSPILRCGQTATALLEGAGHPCAMHVKEDLWTGRLWFTGSGDYETATPHPLFRRWGSAESLRRWARGEAGPGFRSQPEVRTRLKPFVMGEDRGPGIHVAVTHDSVVALAAYLFTGWLPVGEWPMFLEGLATWKEGDVWHARFMGREGPIVS